MEATGAAATGSSAGAARPGGGGQVGTIREATLLPTRTFHKDSRYATLRNAVAGRSLGSADLMETVKKPSGCDEEEWLAVTTVEIFNGLNLLLGATAEWCTDDSCPQMSAGTMVYLWADGAGPPTPMSAPRYCEQLLTWVDKQLADETFLPTAPGAPFPITFRKGMRVIHKRLFRIYAHIFHAHYKHFRDAEADAHLMHCFKYFICFVKEFNLIDEDQLEPLKDLIEQIMEQQGHSGTKLPKANIGV